MRLLIVTQVLDEKDSVLGFFHRWVEEFAKNTEHIEVICLKEGKHSLPANVRVHSLGKERGRQSKISYILRVFQFSWRLRNSYDAVFVHMNPEYLVIAGWLWKLLRKRTGLWYTHGTVSLRLILGTLFANVVFTASEQSMRLHTKKKRVMGHGMDLSMFGVHRSPKDSLRLVTVSRITPVKNIENIIDALVILRERGITATLSVLGDVTANESTEYLTKLRTHITCGGLADNVIFLGKRDQKGVEEELSRSHLFIHASATGSLDKAPLEALATGVPVVSVNAEIANGLIEGAIFASNNPEGLASAIEDAVRKRIWEKESIRMQARDYIAKNHSLPVLIRKILAILA